MQWTEPVEGRSFIRYGSKVDIDLNEHPHRLDTPFGAFDLMRSEKSLPGGPQAWDGADRLLLDLAFDVLPTSSTSIRVLIVGDQYGALTVGIGHLDPDGWTDSAVSGRAIANNVVANQRRVRLPLPLPLDDSVGESPFDVVLWRVPRVTAYLQEQAAVLAGWISERTIVLAAGLDKYLPPATREVLSQLGETSTFPGAYKAHAFRVNPKNLTTEERAAQVVRPKFSKVQIPEFNLAITARANVFSSDHLDLGTRVMLSALDKLPNVARIADLGCGSGALGLAAMRRLPETHVVFFDESHAAINAARTNLSANVADTGAIRTEFCWMDGMRAYGGDPFDLVLLNPPFHQTGTVTDDTAWGLFLDAREHLRTDGELWVVGNRHLGYHVKLRRIFGNSTQIVAHPKFVVLRAVKRANNEPKQRTLSSRVLSSTEHDESVEPSVTGAML
jgi:23S rRNA (guanine1835-N2)-methyltransferase